MAAVEAQIDAGLPVSVLAIETAGKYGGTAAQTGGCLACNAPSSVEANDGQPTVNTETLFADWIENYSDGTGCKPECVELMMYESGYTLDWLLSHGFVFTSAIMGGTAKNPEWRTKYEYIYGGNKKEGIDYEALYPNYQFTGTYPFLLSMPVFPAQVFRRCQRVSKGVNSCPRDRCFSTSVCQNAWLFGGCYRARALGISRRSGLSINARSSSRL